MSKILSKSRLSDEVYKLEVEAPNVARERKAGQFVIVQVDEDFGERIPLTIADADPGAGSVTLVFQTVGASTHALADKEVGDSITLLGPLGNPTHIERFGKAVCVGGGIGLAPLHPIVQALKAAGNEVVVIAGARTKELLIMEEELGALADEFILVTDDGSAGRKALVTEPLKELCASAAPPDIVVAIGPPIMMKFCAETTRPFGVKTLVSLNTIMIDGTGMCGGCRVSVGGETKFVCVDGPEFDGHLVDWNGMMSRLRSYKSQEDEAHHKCHIGLDAKSAAEAGAAGGSEMNDATHDIGKEELEHAAHEELRKIAAIRSEGRELSPRDRLAIPTQDMPCQDSGARAHNMSEVAEGYSEAQARLEAERCLDCKNAPCVQGCPVRVDIPGFIKKIREGDFQGSARAIKRTNLLPSICGRVCPQETQCQAFCTLGKSLKSVDKAVQIGRLERWVADRERACGACDLPDIGGSTGKKVAVVGSGPAGLTTAIDLRRAGHQVVVYEAFQKTGGVMVYGIPEFRLPKSLVAMESGLLSEMGVRYELNFLVGRTRKLGALIREDGFDAVFIGAGAGLPKFMDMPGENLVGVFSANEYLTRANLMKAYDRKRAATPIYPSRRVAVLGGGNVAMDSARMALRLGAEEVRVLYRRTREEMPARAEEVGHAMEEGVIFDFLTSPTKVLGSDKGIAEALEILSYSLGEPDASGRRSPVPIKGSERVVPFDTIIVAIGNESNPLLAKTTPDLKVDKRGHILVDGKQKTSMDRVYAGGDIVLGAATVILAMGEGRRAAAAINELLG